MSLLISVQTAVFLTFILYISVHQVIIVIVMLPIPIPLILEADDVAAAATTITNRFSTQRQILCTILSIFVSTEFFLSPHQK